MASVPQMGKAKQGTLFLEVPRQVSRIPGRKSIQAAVTRSCAPAACIAKARPSGGKLGPPEGTLGLPRLDGKGHEIRQFLRFEVSKNAIPWITNVSRPTLVYFINSRCLQAAQRAFTHEPGQYSDRGDACVAHTAPRQTDLALRLRLCGSH